MTDQAATASTTPAIHQPTRQAIEAKTRSKAGAVTGKLAAAIDLMIEAGLMWDKAAMQAGLTVRSMRLAMQRPHVVAYIKAKREVFRTHASAGNIHRLVQMRDQDDNKMAVVQAIKALEQIGDEQHATRGAALPPGLVIVINGAGSSAPVTDGTLIDQQLRPETALMGHKRSEGSADE